MGSSSALLYLFYLILLLKTVISLADSPAGRVLRLDLHHVRGPGSSLINDSSTALSVLLAHDQSRVESLIQRINRSASRSSAGTKNRSVSVSILGPESVTVPVNPGQSIGSGNYFIKLGLGTPPKFYSMIMDTGSSLSWLQCEPCTISCHPQADPVFDPSASKTYKTSPCSSSECSLLKAATLNSPSCSRSGSCIYVASYGDNSISVGFLARDVLTLGPAGASPSFVFGCGQDNEGLFGRAAGIIGFARQSLSMLGQLSQKFGNAFSYCLPASTGGGKGFLSIGIGSSGKVPYKFTPMLTDSQVRSLYFLSLALIKVGGRPLPVRAAEYKVRTIIDSGTVITRLPGPIYSALSQAFKSIMSRKFASAPSYSILDTCFKGSLKSGSVPPIQLAFVGGAELVLNPENVLIDTEEGTTCLAFAGSSGDGGIAIIGNRQQQTFEVLYDVSSSRIGFAPGRCH
ncbi:aspartyl protease family protein At5g10770-like [Punica granatum]|uniref:Peptidase A1 domain-containing protein n=2 Tax=Punica granatum TaxID=22663 RepID=A0A218XGZ0_PUNGR|nr:aspartyl protease family protein At5g10770-like [Punica granatum]OWM83602.1 hypothetical protein CDL15_Pgr004031 [Punica granatum]PKI61586.1 hypothetical protein CRG98_018015 [Punica granatum]